VERWGVREMSRVKPCVRREGVREMSRRWVRLGVDLFMECLPGLVEA
jgi:hypothetical protein